MTTPEDARQSGEFALLDQLSGLLSPAGEDGRVLLGSGDDAAVVQIGLQRVVVAVDAMVEGIHFDPAISSWRDVGWKVVAVNVSDLAAMGAVPDAAVMVLQRGPGLRDADAVEMYAGIRAAADHYDVRLVGGDTVDGPATSISLTILGHVGGSHVLRRDGARAGDKVVVVHDALRPLGAAAAGLQLVTTGERKTLGVWPALAAAHRQPLPSIEAGLFAVELGATSGIDVSDGLGRDAGHVAASSGVAIQLDADLLPVHPSVADACAVLGIDPVDLMLSGGDDYALLLTMPSERVDAMVAAANARHLEATVIGAVAEGEGTTVVRGGLVTDISTAGWEHAGGSE